MPSSDIPTNLLLAQQITIYISYIILIGGLIGNTLNLITFTRLKIFRSQQCIFYFIIKSIIDYIHLLLLLISQLSTDAFHYNTSQKSYIWCKLSLSIYQTCTQISLITICFAAINQYLSTNYNHHLRNSIILKFIHQLFIISISICILNGILFFLIFEIQSLSNCTMYNIVFLRYYMFFDLPILICFFPLFISSIFSCLAYRNDRRLIRPQLEIIRRRLNKQLTDMILVPVIF